MKKTSLAVLAVLCLLLVYGCGFNPPLIMEKDVNCSDGAVPVLKSGQKIKVLCWNVQYMAGKKYFFFYDDVDPKTGKMIGPDMRPSSANIAITIDEVARVIKEENPDIIFLQELDDGSSRTDNKDQLKILLKKISEEYKCSSEAFYHKSMFIPHPKIMGSIGMKLSTISKYQMTTARRFQLALKRANDFASRVAARFDLKRAALETRHPVEGGKDFIVLNTHFSAFAQGEDTLKRQVELIKDLLTQYNTDGNPWVFGGDTNLLAPGPSYDRLEDNYYYQKDSELKILTDSFAMFPSLEDVDGPDREKFFTMYPNHGKSPGPDRTIDFVFYSGNVKTSAKRVIQKGTLDISDHLPIVMDITLP